MHSGGNVAGSARLLPLHLLLYSTVLSLFGIAADSGRQYSGQVNGAGLWKGVLRRGKFTGFP